MAERKPRIFIASSVEGLPVAEALNLNLEHNMEVSIWRVGTFSLSNQTLDDLIKKSKWVDFGLFVFTPDDIAVIRDKTEHIARDNVIFELGLFIGALGKERCFIIKPRGVELHLPSDLAGVTTADYEPNRSDNDISSAVTSSCVLIKADAKRLGKIGHSEVSSAANTRREPLRLNIGRVDDLVIGFLISSETTGSGYSSWGIKGNLKNINETAVDISLIKLERMGFISKSLQHDEHNQYEEYLAYSISQDGIEYVLMNEDKFTDTVIPF